MISFGQIPKGLRASLFFAEITLTDSTVGTVAEFIPKPFECVFIGDGSTSIFNVYRQTSTGPELVKNTKAQNDIPLDLNMWDLNSSKKMWSLDENTKMWKLISYTLDTHGQIYLSEILEDGITASISGTYY